MKRFSSYLITTAVWALLCLTNAFAQNEQALAILAKAKEAIGGAAKIQSVYSLSTKLKFRHTPPVPEAPELSGELEFSLLLPDKFMKAETIQPPDGPGSTTMIETLNGERFWADVKSSGPEMVIGFGGGEAFRAAHLSELRQTFARHLLALLLTTPSTLPVAWNYAGEAEDGRADVLEAHGMDGFAVRLFLDKQTHLPLLLSYRSRTAPMFTAAAPASGAVRGVARHDVMIAAAPIGGAAHGHGMIVAAEGQRKELVAGVPAPPGQEFGLHSVEDKEVELQIRLSDYREVDGLRLPHRFIHTIDDKPNQEWEVVSYTLNPPLQPEQFEAKQKK